MDHHQVYNAHINGECVCVKKEKGVVFLYRNDTKRRDLNLIVLRSECWLARGKNVNKIKVTVAIGIKVVKNKVHAFQYRNSEMQ